MKQGINVAQEIHSGSLYALASRQDKERSKICFFISHKEEDTEAAIELGNHIMEDFGYNIYLDVYDKTLQNADKNNDVEGVVNAIHQSIQYASHLICIISEKSKNSWWIPYEIGFAKANNVKTSSLKIKQTEYLPSYLRINDSPVFLTLREIDDYLSKNGKYGVYFSREKLENLKERMYKHFNL